MPNNKQIVKPWVQQSLHNSIEEFLNKLAADEGKCLHDSCLNCHGKGVNKYTGQACVHMISCKCRKCSKVTF